MLFLPLCIILQTKQYLLTLPISSESLLTHIQLFFENKLEPDKKSEVIETEDNSGAVLIVEQNTFNELLVDNKKDVMIKVQYRSRTCLYAVIIYYINT